MIETFTLADMRKMVAARPMGWRRFTIGDLHHANGEKRLAGAFFRDMSRKRFYTATNTGPMAAGGSVWTWSDSAGTPTFNLTLQNLATGSLRQGVKSTTTIVAPPNGGTNAVPPSFFAVQLTVTFTSAPTAGGEVQTFLGFSPSSSAGTSNPGGLSGTDAAGTNTDQLPQMTFAGSLIASNNLSTTANYQTPFAVVNTDPTNSPYVSPQIYNNSSVNLKNTANTSTLSMIPYWIQTAA